METFMKFLKFYNPFKRIRVLEEALETEHKFRRMAEGGLQSWSEVAFRMKDRAEDHEETISVLEDALLGADKVVEEHAAYIQELQDTIREKEAFESVAAQTMLEACDLIERLSEVIEAQDDEIEELEGELEDLEDELDDMNVAFAFQEAALAGLRKQSLH
jgi:chromosome segregation ATPase